MELKDLKVGDSVFVVYHPSYQGKDRSLQVIGAVTPKGFIRVANGNLYRPDGSCRSQSSSAWSWTTIEVATPEMIEEHKQKLFVSRVNDILHGVTLFQYEDACKVYALLSEISKETVARGFAPLKGL